MSRRLVRPARSAFRAGDSVRVQCDSTLDAIGVVIECLSGVTRWSVDGNDFSSPGVVVRVSVSNGDWTCGDVLHATDSETTHGDAR